MVAAAILAVAVAGGPSRAASVTDWVRKFVPPGGRLPTPVTARYTSDVGVGFVLDRSGGRPLLKFDDSAEVWVLLASRGPRGDILYSDDIGEPFLRSTHLGGMTVFTATRPEGSAVALLGPTQPLRLPSLGWVRYTQRMLQASLHATRAVQHTVSFDGPGADPGARDPPADIGSDGVVADAAALAADAIIVLAARSGGHGAAAGLNTVALRIGARPDVVYRAGVILVTVAPSQGYAGRPSSRRILRALGLRPTP